MAATYEHSRPALTVDCVVFGFDGSQLNVLAIRRGLAPFKGRWALPGGFVRVEETVDEAARRELAEEAGLERVFLEQLYTFGALKRDPRERVVTVAYYALVKMSDHSVRASTDASDAQWHPVTELPTLAFDHAEIVAVAHERLRGKVRYRPLGFELLPPKFTLTQIQSLYEAILGRTFDKRNFRKKLAALEVIVSLDEMRRESAGRPAQLFRFDAVRYARLEKQGVDFEL